LRFYINQNEHLLNENTQIRNETCDICLCAIAKYSKSKSCDITGMSTDQDWIGLDQDWGQFWPDQDWIGLRKILLRLCDYSEHINNFSCDPILQICWMEVYFER